MKNFDSSRYPYILLSLLWSIFFISFSIRMTPSIVMPLIKQELGISYTQVGLLLTTMNVFYGLIQLPAGIMSDIYGYKKIYSIFLVTSSLVMFILGSSNSYFHLFLGLIVAGICTGFSYPLNVSLISQVFTKRRGLMIGIYESAPPMAQFLGTTISGIVGSTYGWNISFYIWAIPNLILGVIAWKFLKEQDKNDRVYQFDNKVLKDLFSNKPFIYFMLTYLANSTCAVSFIMMAPSYMTEMYKLDLITTTTIFSSTRLTGMIGSLTGGFLSDRFSKSKIILSSLITSAFSTFAFTILPFGIWTIISLCTCAFSVNLFYPVIFSLVADITSPLIRGKASGFYNTVVFTFSSLTPFIMGLITDAVSFEVAFFFPFSIVLIGAGITLILLIKHVGEVKTN